MRYTTVSVQVYSAPVLHVFVLYCLVRCFYLEFFCKRIFVFCLSHYSENIKQTWISYLTNHGVAASSFTANPARTSCRFRHICQSAFFESHSTLLNSSHITDIDTHLLYISDEKVLRTSELMKLRSLFSSFLDGLHCHFSVFQRAARHHSRLGLGPLFVLYEKHELEDVW